MWLEHLLFGARYGHELRGELQGASLGQYQSFLRYHGERTAKRASSLTSLRKDNEVKLEDEIKLVCNE